MSELINAAIVGCGRHGARLPHAATNTKKFRIVACVDIDRTAADAVARSFEGAMVGESLSEVLEATDIEAALIATSHDALASVALEAITAGKHVMVEKPIATSAKEGLALVKAAKEQGVCLMSGYSFRYLPGVQRFKNLLDAGAVGDIRGVVGVFGGRPLSGWLAKPEMGGGVLLYLGSHLIDRLLWCVGDDPVEVNADADFHSDTGIPGTIRLRVHFRNGAAAQCFISDALTGISELLSVYGSEGNLSLRSVDTMQHEVDVVSRKIEAYLTPTILPCYLPMSTTGHMACLVPELEEFATAIEEKREPTITGADGVRVLQVIDAVMESARNNTSVPIEAF